MKKIRDTIVKFRASKEEKDLLRELAKKDEESMSKFLRKKVGLKI